MLQRSNPSAGPAEIHASLRQLYCGLLANPAVSGLRLGTPWRLLNPNPRSSPQAYDWSYLDDAFSGVDAWNASHPTQAPKTIQIGLTPGFTTPQWVMDQIPSCDGLFMSPPQTPPNNCGKATFLGFAEGGGGVLPLPWNTFYKTAFRAFLMAFAAEFATNPALVSMDISGPTAASTEMILPTDSRTPPQAQFGGITANDMWLKLLAFAYPGQPAYQKSDQAFIDEWNAATDMFAEIFHGTTLVATVGAGLPNLASKGFTVPAAFKADCGAHPDMDCAAETTILAHFVDPAVAPDDAKATQESGLNGRSGETANGVKRRAQSTAQLTAPAAQILGGLQLTTSAARAPLNEGCTSKFPLDKDSGTALAKIPAVDIPAACLAPGITPANLAAYKQYSDVPSADLISPEQALYNVLRNFFEETPAAASFGGTPGSAPLNYLQIYAEDFDYAAAHANTPAAVVQTDGTSLTITAQDLLNRASQKLQGIAEPNHAP